MMLQNALRWAKQIETNGAKSDGCTWAPELGLSKFCKMHDFLIRFKKVSRFEADNLFFKGIMTKGWLYLPVAVSYYLAVRWVAICGGSFPVAASSAGLALAIGLLWGFG